jgi:hypothetical protein
MRILAVIPLAFILGGPAYGIDLSAARKPTVAVGRDAVVANLGGNARQSNLDGANQLLARESAYAAIEFVGRTDRLAPGSNPKLMRLVNAIVEVRKEFPDVMIVVEDHTDASDSSEADRELSGRRAAVVASELIRMGIPNSKCTYVGYGSSQPLVTGTTPAQRAKNNRVLVQVGEKGTH